MYTCFAYVNESNMCTYNRAYTNNSTICHSFVLKGGEVFETYSLLPCRK